MAHSFTDMCSYEWWEVHYLLVESSYCDLGLPVFSRVLDCKTFDKAKFRFSQNRVQMAKLFICRTLIVNSSPWQWNKQVAKETWIVFLNSRRKLKLHAPGMLWFSFDIMFTALDSARLTVIWLVTLIWRKLILMMNACTTVFLIGAENYLHRQKIPPKTRTAVIHPLR